MFEYTSITFNIYSHVWDSVHINGCSSHLGICYLEIAFSTMIGKCKISPFGSTGNISEVTI